MTHITDPVFPIDIALNAAAIPQYKTEVIELNSGHEQRNKIWSYPRHRYDIGYGLKTDADFNVVRDWFHVCYGRLHSFNYLDHSDQLSTDPSGTISVTDQLLYTVADLTLAVGDGVETDFQAVKEYSTTTPVIKNQRKITRLQADTIIVALDGTPTVAFTVDEDTGIVTFNAAPGVGVVPTCGFKFMIPVRFDIDALPVTRLELNYERAPISLVEKRE